MRPSLASFAQYFRIGVEVGLCKPQEARDWAISVIDEMDEPPGEIIEVSWRKPLPQLISDLNDVKGEPDVDLVCSSLLGRLSLTLTTANDYLGQAVLQAREIARAAGNSDLYDLFNVMDDQLCLAETQTYGTVSECREDFEKALEEHRTPPLISLQN
ncbi:hypothetical protein [Massilia pseudoviolaceinigra]|uniref:hypothetical protein n=1 Tax=Massilia pseudoviolaceinigra TaxID=3057165 RepID=UPI002796A2E2|nr:hypothetical protein [Massilia sp. CCM 9206]MDQ1923116.1 hypothetical protein [Massilia sp. CCM 9206]